MLFMVSLLLMLFGFFDKLYHALMIAVLFILAYVGYELSTQISRFLAWMLYFRRIATLLVNNSTTLMASFTATLVTSVANGYHLIRNIESGSTSMTDTFNLVHTTARKYTQLAIEQLTMHVRFITKHYVKQLSHWNQKVSALMTMTDATATAAVAAADAAVAVAVAAKAAAANAANAANAAVAAADAAVAVAVAAKAAAANAAVAAAAANAANAASAAVANAANAAFAAAGANAAVANAAVAAAVAKKPLNAVVYATRFLSIMTNPTIAQATVAAAVAAKPAAANAAAANVAAANAAVANAAVAVAATAAATAAAVVEWVDYGVENDFAAAKADVTDTRGECVRQ